MLEFIKAALPWVCIGMCIALCAVNFAADRKARKEDKKHGNFITEGMCVGMLFSVALGAEFIPVGMLLGMTVGMCIKKR